MNGDQALAVTLVATFTILAVALVWVWRRLSRREQEEQARRLEDRHKSTDSGRD